MILEIVVVLRNRQRKYEVHFRFSEIAIVEMCAAREWQLWLAEPTLSAFHLEMLMLALSIVLQLRYY